jgi:hypothetical protein
MAGYIKFESAARASDAEDAPPLVSGGFVDAAGDATTSIAGIEAAWGQIGCKTARMIPLLLSPLHRLKLYFDPADVGEKARKALESLTRRLAETQLVESTKAHTEDSLTLESSSTVYDPHAPSLLLIPAESAARIEGAAGSADRKIVCNPQTPERDWFRVLNHHLAGSEDVRLLPLLVVSGTSTAPPRYAAVEVPASGGYFERHLELRDYGVKHDKDPGVQWAVCCDYTKMVLRQLQENSEEFAVRELVMSHDRSLRGVLVANYSEDMLAGLRARFGLRLLDGDL